MISGPSARRTGGLPATEGDLIVGSNGASAVSTLVERAARFLVLLPVASRDSATATAGRVNLKWDLAHIS